MQDSYKSRVRKQAGEITADLSQPENLHRHTANNLFQLLPTGKRYRARHAKTSRHLDRLFPQAVTLCNTNTLIVFVLKTSIITAAEPNRAVYTVLLSIYHLHNTVKFPFIYCMYRNQVSLIYSFSPTPSH